MKKGQVSLEFLFIFMIFTLILIYSIRMTTFESGPSVEVARTQISLEEKALADAISNTISQVYAHGPGSKSTTYVHLTYLRWKTQIERVYGINNPSIFITYKNGTCVTIKGVSWIEEGGNKTVFCSESLLKVDWSNNGTIYNPSTTHAGNQGLEIPVEKLKKTLKIVVEWNPDKSPEWSYNEAEGTLYINIGIG
ncbi:class III signal peptide-containing protein [Pyrococcus furiosus DSM 3638]|uniref:Class III signal peptide-containing protein n=3 Tax=Pyrococcus furiosus TaxID=2261 RepID=Q8U0S5_PYRFU|nr:MULTISPECIES: class III signal peptide-containing protein [Pyrococcus]AAL81633.1 hypothetical protein PF1509 [Pyrococcus furiosus DSM 3638]AFN04292.1 hypothetical protein PFC_06780 [Pyrococcus furiosus COM1]MDK2869959.1 hypothetical protein [Pyrococcus sp.]QEK79135.1 class III signal peptide-containing protein [Pyrococcus furiosus DSM 3638]